MRRFALLLALAASAVADDLSDRLFVVRITTVTATGSGTSRQALAAPALLVGEGGLLLAVGFSLPTAPEEPDQAVRVVAFDPSGREMPARILGGVLALNCTFFRVAAENLPPPVPLAGVALKPGDEIRLLSRHAERFAYAPRFKTTRVIAAADRPERLFALEEMLVTWQGAVAVDSSGALAGFIDSRPGFAEGTGAIVGLRDSTEVLVPADAFAEAARNPPQPGTRRTKAWLGVGLAPFDADHEAYFGVSEDMKGAMVTSVSEGSPAGRAGLRVFDVVRRIGPLEIFYEKQGEWDDLLRRVQALPTGEALLLEFVRFEPQEDSSFLPEEMRSTITLEERPVDWEEAREVQVESLGIHVKPLTQDRRRAMALPADASGAVVTRIEQGSPAQLAGLRTDDLILGLDRQLVRDIPALLSALNAARDAKKEKVVLFVRRGVETAFVAITPSW